MSNTDNQSVKAEIINNVIVAMTTVTCWKCWKEC